MPNSSDQINIALGLSAADMMPFDAATCLIETLANIHHPVVLCAVKSSFVQNNRNIIVEKARQAKATHLMFIDTDMLYENNGIQRLLDHDKDIVGGMYNKRQFPLENIVKPYNGETELFQADLVPTGFLLIKMSVFDKLTRPYFWLENLEGFKLDSDDNYFCRKAKEAGFEIWCDPTIKIKHIGQFAY